MKKLLLLISMFVMLQTYSQNITTPEYNLPKWIYSESYIGLDTFQIPMIITFKENKFNYDKYYIKDTLLYKELRNDTIRYFYFYNGVCYKYMKQIIMCDYVYCEVWCLKNSINDCYEFEIPLWTPRPPEVIKNILLSTATPKDEIEKFMINYNKIWNKYKTKKENEEKMLANRKADFSEKIKLEKINFGDFKIY